jgi:hypothetical protein
VNHRPLGYSGAYSAFKKMLCNFGFSEKMFGLHSMRAGGTTDAFREKVPENIIDMQGRWKSPNSKFVYCRPTYRYRAKCIRSILKY